MRPLKLSIKGFTSYRDEQEIDFSDLDLFALWGPTGSGKSSLLDAMTYALYGTVERLEGRESITQLISQGQPRMAVTLEFRAGGADFRITRTIPSGGQTKVLLEKRAGDEWRSYGEGADKVGGANRAVVDLVGLDYDAFTRSVLLPQGKFAEFLIGEARDRRDILTELLGLDLFDKMARRANEIAKEHHTQVEVKADLLEREYALVTEDALDAARAKSDELADQAEAARLRSENLERLAREHEGRRRTYESMGPCLKEVDELAAAMDRHAVDLGELAAEARTHEKALAGATHAEAKARSAMKSATTARSEAESRWGPLDSIGVLIGEARALDDVVTRLAESEGELEASRTAVADRTDELEAAQRACVDAGDALESAKQHLDHCAGAHEQAVLADRVGALVHGLDSGDPCPVCERPLKTVPAADGEALESVATAHEKARQTHHDALQSHARAGGDIAARRQRLDAATAHVAELEAAADKLRSEAARRRESLAPAFEGDLPGDAAAQLEKRRVGLRELISTEDEAAAELTDARAALDEIERGHRDAAAAVERIRTAMASAPLDGVVARIGAAADHVEIPDLISGDLPGEAGPLADEAERLVKSLDRLRDNLEGRRREVEAAAAAIVDRMGELAGVEARDPVALVEAARRVAFQIADEATVARQGAERLAGDLDKKRGLEADIASHQRERATYKELHQHLKADRIVQFLQGEALALLASAASERLRDLSDGRYRLRYEDDRFFVVDSWNGDERRNVRTLSGGETFLTSLALALALSEQIQLLAVTEKGRLESLFLDEGFGSLDNETLDVVVDAIEQLRDEDRLVGVVTHVPELAARMPVRIEVSKSPRGSSLRRAVGELGVVAPHA